MSKSFKLLHPKVKKKKSKESNIMRIKTNVIRKLSKTIFKKVSRCGDKYNLTWMRRTIVNSTSYKRN